MCCSVVMCVAKHQRRAVSFYSRVKVHTMKETGKEPIRNADRSEAVTQTDAENDLNSSAKIAQESLLHQRAASLASDWPVVHLFGTTLGVALPLWGRSEPPEFFSHRHRTSMTRATVEDSTGALGKGEPTTCDPHARAGRSEDPT